MLHAGGLDTNSQPGSKKGTSVSSAAKTFTGAIPSIQRHDDSWLGTEVNKVRLLNIYTTNKTLFTYFVSDLCNIYTLCLEKLEAYPCIKNYSTSNQICWNYLKISQCPLFDFLKHTAYLSHCSYEQFVDNLL